MLRFTHTILCDKTGLGKGADPALKASGMAETPGAAAPEARPGGRVSGPAPGRRSRGAPPTPARGLAEAGGPRLSSVNGEVPL